VLVASEVALALVVSRGSAGLNDGKHGAPAPGVDPGLDPKNVLVMGNRRLLRLIFTMGPPVNARFCQQLQEAWRAARYRLRGRY